MGASQRAARERVSRTWTSEATTNPTRADHTDNWSRRLGEERAGRAWHCRDLWDSGADVVLGSDWPIAP
ncbi:hypothetical protein [Streptomyces sp. CA-132043]|uniref:hypothetical protein n=1 Tax=Streptomyces sp. CA-132043 TaxID=3240048 RepID=UPI003D8DD462